MRGTGLFFYKGPMNYDKGVLDFLNKNNVSYALYKISDHKGGTKELLNSFYCPLCLSEELSYEWGSEKFYPLLRLK